MKYKEFYNLIIEAEGEDPDEKDEEKDEETEDQTPKDEDKEEKDDEKDQDEDKDPDKEFTKGNGEDAVDKEEQQKEFDDTIAMVADKISDSFRQVITDKSDIIIQKIQKEGIAETVVDYINNYYIKSLEDPQEKLFVTVNIDDLAPLVQQSLSLDLLKTNEK